jgi:hypothetical protein
MNTLAYIIYLLVTGYITVYVGNRCFHHGRIYLEKALDDDFPLAANVNRLLLTGYYLVNLGYMSLMITGWETIFSYEQLFLSVAIKCGRIILTLGLMHYLNLFVILWWHHHNHSIHQKNIQL